MKRLSTFLAALAAILVALPALAGGEDVTSKLVNPNFDDGIQGWSVVFTTTDNFNGYCWTTIPDHNEAIGHGHFGLVAPTLFLETPQGVSPNASSVSQTLKGMKNGTYVFSAIAAFATRLPDREAKGGFLFANDNKVEGCDINPWYNDRWNYLDAYTRRYQVAATVTDGEITVGFSTIDGCSIHCVDADNCELWYFGDVNEDEALVEMGTIHRDQLKATTQAILDGPITTDGAAALQNVLDLADAAETADKLCWAEDTLRIANLFSARSVNKMNELVVTLAAAKEVAEGEWSDEVAVYLAQLKVAVEIYQADIDNKNISSELVDSYKADLIELMNQVKIDELYALNDQLYTFINDPSAVSEDAPLFGLTEHPGFGDEVGQYPVDQLDILEAIFEEVDQVLSAVAEGTKSASEAMAYVSKINAAVASCIRSANSEAYYTFPYYWVAVPTKDDPTKPITTPQSTSDEYLIENFSAPQFYCGLSYDDVPMIYRLTTPLMKFDKAYKSITFTVNTTMGMGMNTTNDGPWFGIQEMCVLDGDGEVIELTGDDFTYNSMYPDGASSTNGLVDHDAQHDGNYLSQFLTNGSSQANRGNHWICITFPEPVTEAKFIFESWFNDWWFQNGTITSMTFTGYTEGEAVLGTAINHGEGLETLFGLEPAYYPVSTDELNALIAEGKAMLAAGNASDAEMAALAEKIEIAADAVKSAPMNKAVDGKEYFISQEFTGFVTNQSYKKSLTVFQDSILWFADADPSDKNQKWIVNCVEGDDPTDGLDWYTIQNVGTGKWMSTLISGGQAWEPTGEPINWGTNYMKLSDKPAKVRFEYLNWGHFRIYVKDNEMGEYQRLYVPAHNNGNRSANPFLPGGESEVNPDGYSLDGVCGVVLGGTYTNGAGTALAWGLHEVVNTLPATIELSEKFGDEHRHFATASNTFTFTADKPCAFENFKIFCPREFGQEMAYTAERTVNSISITLGAPWADFRFSFNNNEGVKKLTITTDAPAPGEKTGMEKLIAIYNAAPTDLVEGTVIGNVKSLSAFNDAMSAAEKLLENGGEEAEYEDAANAITEALANLEIVMPEPGKKYVIVNGYDGKIRSGQPVEFGIYYNPTADAPGWTFLDAAKENYQWEFEAGEDGAWYIRNVATGTYLGAPTAKEVAYGMSETPVSYKIIARGGAKVNLRCVVEGSDDTWCIHQKNFNAGFGCFGPLVLYNDHEKSRWYIKELDSYDTGIAVVEDEMGRPVVQGVFDLTGRRVSTPTTGLYIVNGQKVLIK